MVLFRFLFLSGIKILGHVFYSFDFEWVKKPPKNPFKDIRLNLLLNHTSLFEPIFIVALPFSYLWRSAKYATFPAADITMNKLFAGTVLSALVPNSISISRRRDNSWKVFLDTVTAKALIFIAPEGRMKRPNGLDKNGKTMTVRPGIVDVLDKLEGGSILIMHSAGLHHVLPPGQRSPNLFQKIRFRFEYLRLDEYKKSLGYGTKAFRRNVIMDLERRRDRHTSWQEAASSFEVLNF
ncbi:MAG: hypothetical protein COB53_02875 [Elusimicrobia bacterium]|nr:MAG: hypothetical protein COB53_02875 [Elusimicrobiota bacterium]